MPDWNGVVAIITLANLVITVGGGLIAFGVLKAQVGFTNMLLADFKSTVMRDIDRHERHIDDMRRGKGVIVEEMRGAHREHRT